DGRGLAGQDGGDGHAGEDHRPGLRGRLGQGQRDPAHAALDVAPGAGAAVQRAERVEGVDGGRAGIPGPGERADDALAVEGGAEAVVGDVALDDVGDRRVEQDLD